jgi:DNA-3-methyladenine glycosylase
MVTKPSDLALPRSFYARPTLEVARDLVGKVLVHRAPHGLTAGIVVEVEAYIGEDDPACHAAPGPTRRNQPLYGEPGYAYVYFNYGVHYLANVVTEKKGSPAAVLLRALEPVDGIPLMRRRRSGQRRGGTPIPTADLCRGPGNLTRAMGIALFDNLVDLCGDRLFITDRGIVAAEIAWSPRVGISVGTDRRWRCAVVGSRAVSGPRRAANAASSPPGSASA